MSDTPRTDDEVANAIYGDWKSDWISAEFARTLERDLAARDAEVARLQSALRTAADELNEAADALDAAAYPVCARRASQAARAALAQPKEPT